MAYLAVDSYGTELIFKERPCRSKGAWYSFDRYKCIVTYDENKIWLPEGSIEKLIGRKLTWEDGPFELK